MAKLSDSRTRGHRFDCLSFHYHVKLQSWWN